jgi:hypothetical protein
LLHRFREYFSENCKLGGKSVKILFETEFKKKIKDIIQNVNQIFLTNLQAKTIQLQDFDI